MGPGVTSSSSAESPEPPRDSASAPDSRARVLTATRSEHTAIFQFLSTVFHAPSVEEFRALLDDPAYDPRNRLLAVCDSQIVAHAQATSRVLQFGDTAIPVGTVNWLGVLPAFRGQGYAQHVLASAERHLARQGAVAALLWTRTPEFFRRKGWAVCGPRRGSRAGTREVLAELAARGLYPQSGRRLNVRPWRRVEISSLVRLYNQAIAGLHGPFRRTEAGWQWLAEHRGYDQLYVAVSGANRVDREDFNTPILGYAAIRGERIVELLTAPESASAGVELLVRACSDAVECDRSTIVLHAPPDHPLHCLMRGGHAAGRATEGDEVLMVRLLNPLKLLRLLAGPLLIRAQDANLPCPMELGLAADRKRYHLQFSSEGLTAAARTQGEGHLALSTADFARMVLGYFDWDDAAELCRVQAPSPDALSAARAIFPRLAWWHPLLEDLPAQQ